MPNTTDFDLRNQCNLNNFNIKPLYTIEYANLYKIPLQLNTIYFYNPFTRNTIIHSLDSNSDSLDNIKPINNECFLKDQRFVTKIIKEYKNVFSSPLIHNLFREKGWYVLFNRVFTPPLIHDNIYTAPFYVNDKNNAITENPPMLSLNNGICDSCHDEYDPFTWDTKLIGRLYLQNGKII